MTIRLATDEDKDAVWAILEPMIRRGDAFPLPREMRKSQALEYWFTPENEIFVWQDDGAILGTYFLRANQRAGGAHVANCGYVTAAGAEGRGIARDVSTLSATFQGTRVPRHAIQLRGQHQQPSGETVERPRL
jgi:hypothetical protein